MSKETVIISFENEAKTKKGVVHIEYDHEKEEMQAKVNYEPELDPSAKPELYAIMTASYMKLLMEGAG